MSIMLVFLYLFTLKPILDFIGFFVCLFYFMTFQILNSFRNAKIPLQNIGKKRVQGKKTTGVSKSQFDIFNNL